MHPILLSYVPVADMVARTFGEDCEVLLHDLTTPQHSIVHAANNRVTGRRIGESFRNLVQKALFSGDRGEGEDFVANYYYEFEGRLIRSSSLLIRDEKGTLIGAMCINVDCTHLRENMRWLSRAMPDFDEAGLARASARKTEAPVEGDRNVQKMVYDLIDKILNEARDTDTKERRIEVIRFMNERGIFLMKGALERVADRLGISKVTVYSYLDEVRRRD
jgi:predicted transcriptional regulator YheO